MCMKFVSKSILLNQPPVKAIRLLRERRGWNLDGMEETVINFALPLSLLLLPLHFIVTARPFPPSLLCKL